MTKIFGFEFKPELYYNEHVWTKIEEDGNVRVGFDDIVAKGSHEIFFVKISYEGTELKQKKKMGMLESRKYTGPIVSPVSGTIVALNEEVSRLGPSAFKDDPYGNGWLAIIKPSNLEAELKNLLYGSPAQDWFTKEAEKAEVEGKFVKTA